MEGFAEEIALKLAHKIRDQSNLNNLNYVKVKYGLEVLILNFCKLVFMFMAAGILGILKETCFIIASFAFIRRYAFGVHAKSSVECTLLTSALFLTGAYLPVVIQIGIGQIVLMNSITVLLLWIYAPADTEARPLLKAEQREELKKRAVSSQILLILLIISIPNLHLRFLLSYGSLCEALTVTPIVYKLMNRRYRNYENY